MSAGLFAAIRTRIFRFDGIFCTIALMEGNNGQPHPESPWKFSEQDGAVSNLPPSPVVSSEWPAAATQTVDSGNPPQQIQTAPNDGAEITWTASEYIAHHKTAAWFASLFGIAALLILVAWFLTKDVLAVVVIAVGAIVFAAFANRPPQQQRYALYPTGFAIGTHFHPYAEFRSFAIVPEGAFSNITFSPLRRFGLFASIYYDPQDEERIMDILSRHLPYEPPRKDAIDNLLRRIRF